ncbi:unnamed protein product [Symbiodinium sp. KB8]|nr:unnamed protein product [Symbiodinium sp. KB8]
MGLHLLHSTRQTRGPDVSFIVLPGPALRWRPASSKLQAATCSKCPLGNVEPPPTFQTTISNDGQVGDWNKNWTAAPYPGPAVRIETFNAAAADGQTNSLFDFWQVLRDFCCCCR